MCYHDAANRNLPLPVLNQPFEPTDAEEADSLNPGKHAILVEEQLGQFLHLIQCWHTDHGGQQSLAPCG